MEQNTESVSHDQVDKIAERIKNEYDGAAMQFKMLKNALSVYYDKKKATSIAKQKMKEINPIKLNKKRVSNVLDLICDATTWPQNPNSGSDIFEAVKSQILQYGNILCGDKMDKMEVTYLARQLKPCNAIKDWSQKIQCMADRQFVKQCLSWSLYKSFVDKMSHSHENDFLRACINFKSVKENLSIFMSGYIRNYIKIFIPSDVFSFCVKYCYQFDYKLLEIKDEWKDRMQDWRESKVTDFEFNDNLTIVRYKADDGYCWNTSEVTGKLRLTSHIRKVWKVKILRNYLENELFTFKIGVRSFDNDYLLSMNECANYGINTIKEGDVLSILYINFIEYGLLKFAINGAILENTVGITASNSNYRPKNTYLVLKMNQKEEIQLLQ